MHTNLKKLVGAAAIAATLGLSAGGVGAGVANAGTPAPSIPGPVHTGQTPADPDHSQAQLVDWHGGRRGGWGDHGDWGRSARNGWGWGGGVTSAVRAGCGRPPTAGCCHRLMV
jgi:hypothetical protein